MIHLADLRADWVWVCDQTGRRVGDPPCTFFMRKASPSALVYGCPACRALTPPRHSGLVAGPRPVSPAIGGPAANMAAAMAVRGLATGWHDEGAGLPGAGGAGVGWGAQRGGADGVGR